ncbi:uncharacterized protein DEA37_0009266, partial [Paragonimus westermani]
MISSRRIKLPTDQSAGKIENVDIHRKLYKRPAHDVWLKLDNQCYENTVGICHVTNGFIQNLVCNFCRGFYLVVCLAIASLTTYRVHLWLTQYTKMASKMMISAYDEHQRDLPFPLVTICNINPTRGHELYNPQTSNPVNRGLDYEMFSDAYQGRVMENAPRNRLRIPIYQIVDRASHRLTDMLKGCFMGHRRCSAKNFTKSILPTGPCYTFNGQTDDLDEIQLILDPQSYDYMIPNQGFIGFRVLLHGRGDPLWATIPGAVYAGPTFHTMLRVVGLKKVYKQHCVPQTQWARCMHQCMQDMLHNRCRCYMADCTLLNMMHCGVKMSSMIENLPPSQCKCQNPCDIITYSIESIIQALKAPLFAHTSSFFATGEFASNSDHHQPTQKVDPFLYTAQQSNDDSHVEVKHPFNNRLEAYRQEIWEGSLIQLWAFLRESNRTAFEQLRQLSRLLQSLNMDLQTVERAVTSVQFTQGTRETNLSPFMWDVKSSSMPLKATESKQTSGDLCIDGEEYARMLARVRRLGEEFVRLFRQSILFRDVSKVPGEDFHIHLVRLFFLRMRNEFDRLASQLQHNDLFSDVTMLDLQRKTHQCEQTAAAKVQPPKLAKNRSDWIGTYADPSRIQLTVESSEDIASLQAVLLATDSQFKQLRTAFTKLTAENQELIETVSVERLPHSPTLKVDQSLVTLTIQLTRDRNRLVRLESVQTIFNPIAELIDLIVSGLVLAFLVVCLLDLCCSRRRACETRLHGSSSTVLAADGLHEENSKLKSCSHGSTCHTIAPLVDLSEVVFGQPAASLSSFSPPTTQTRSIPKYPTEQSNTTRLCSYCPIFTGSDWSTVGRRSMASQ